MNSAGREQVLQRRMCGRATAAVQRDGVDSRAGSETRAAPLGLEVFAPCQRMKARDDRLQQHAGERL